MSATAYYRAGPGVDPTTVAAYPPDLRMLGDGLPGGRAGRACPARPLPPACADAGRAATWRSCSPTAGTGAHVDSADHRAHVAGSPDGQCPDSHPVPIPLLELVIDYGDVDPRGLALSSGPVSSAHADFWNAWDQDKLETEVELCLRRQQVCAVSSG